MLHTNNSAEGQKGVVMKVVMILLLPMGLNAMQIIGHRGACGYAPENTHASFERAIELGVGMIEFDVQRCKSGELVVIHDLMVDRTTNGSGYVSELTLDELQKLDAGDGEQIPTLREVLDRVDQRVAVNIEIKAAGIVGGVAAIIDEYVRERKWRQATRKGVHLRSRQRLCPDDNVIQKPRKGPAGEVRADAQIHLTACIQGLRAHGARCGTHMRVGIQLPIHVEPDIFHIWRRVLWKDGRYVVPEPISNWSGLGLERRCGEGRVLLN